VSAQGRLPECRHARRTTRRFKGCPRCDCPGSNRSTKRQSETASGQNRRLQESRGERQRPRGPAARQSAQHVELTVDLCRAPSSQVPVPAHRPDRVAGSSAHARPPSHSSPKPSSAPPTLQCWPSSAGSIAAQSASKSQ
jgi:hypothetical protein